MDLNTRAFGVNETILSADIGEEDNIADNCYHVFYHPFGLELDPNAVLDGFTITAGQAESSSTRGRASSSRFPPATSRAPS